MKTRQELLNTLLNFDQPLSSILSALEIFPWDSEDQLVILTKDHLTYIIHQYLNNNLSASDVENWANAIENREDIGYESQNEDILDNIIFELANPVLSHSLSPNIAREYLSKLSQSNLTTIVN